MISGWLWAWDLHNVYVTLSLMSTSNTATLITTQSPFPLKNAGPWIPAQHIFNGLVGIAPSEIIYIYLFLCKSHVSRDEWGYITCSWSSLCLLRIQHRVSLVHVAFPAPSSVSFASSTHTLWSRCNMYGSRPSGCTTYGNNTIYSSSKRCRWTSLH